MEMTPIQIFVLTMLSLGPYSISALGDQCSSLDCTFHIVEKMVLMEHKTVEIANQIKSLERKNEELEIVVKTQNKELAERHKEDMKFLQDQLTGLRGSDTAYDMEQRELNLTEQIDDVSTWIWNWTITAPAFLARLKESPYHCTLNSTLRFSDVIMNVNDAFNPEDGQFLAPRKGRYMFSLSIRANLDSTTMVHANIRRNGNIIGSVAAGVQKIQLGYDMLARHWGGSGSTSAIVDLDKNDTVYVSCEDTTSYQARRSYFTGCLLYPL